MVIAAINLTYLPTCVEILRQGRDSFARFMDKSSTLFAVFGIATIAFTTSAGPPLLERTRCAFGSSHGL